MPSPATVTATVHGGNGAITVTSVVASAYVRRWLSEDEIAELPPIPRSIRENARREGVEELTETARVDGGGPIPVDGGGTVTVFLAATTATGSPPGVTLASLVVEVTGGSPVQVPVTVLTAGPTETAHEPIPTELARSIEPGERTTTSVLVDDARSAATVVAYLTSPSAFIRVKSLVALRPERVPLTPEEIEQLPPHPPSIREQAAKHGYIRHIETGRAEGGQPVDVAAGHLLTVEIEFAATEPRPPELVTSTLVIEATTWRRIQVPVSLTIGQLLVTPAVPRLSVAQGDSAPLTIDLTSRAGASTDATLALGMDGGTWRIEPPAVFVPRAGSVRADVRVHVDPRAPMGTYPVGLEVTAFSGTWFRRHPFDLEVRASLVTARLRQTAITANPGTTLTVEVEVVSHGGYKVVTLCPSAPPIGVTMSPVTRELNYGASTTVIPAQITIDPRAPLADDAKLGIRWSAGDGLNEGLLFLTLDVVNPPESRTFRRDITTPAGTALGGWTELTIRSDGTSTFRGHMHGSGLDAYAFRIGVLVRSVNGTITIAALKSGQVGGTFDATPRDFDWQEERTNLLLRSFWSDLRGGTAAFTKAYEDIGALGTLEDIAVAVVEFVAAAVVVGPFVAAAIVVGSELGALTEIPFLHPTAVAGVFVAGAVLLILGPGALIPAAVAGVAAASQVKARPLRESERILATRVFGDTLPFDRILITNFDRDGRAFCVPSLDGSILVCLGSDRYDDPLRQPDWRKTLIHELTHAWQIKHTPIVAEMAFEAAVNEIKGTAETYVSNALDVDGRPWNDYGIERQAQIVGEWYNLASSLNETLDHPVALNMGAFQYIHHNIRMGQP
ncbi:hypothetical protein [Micromonospora sp. NPDC126480]|uniref:COG1470 family protein n=1 Tax=Micromonospora sp. NPDC126480 TaxID=3155312 RepID=UPI0033268E1D